MSDLVSIPASRLAALEAVEQAASEWLRAWQTAQTNTKTSVAFEASKRLAATVRANP